MIKKNQLFLNQLNMLLDVLLIFATFLLSSWLWLDVHGRDYINVLSIHRHGFLAAGIYAVMIFLMMYVLGFYSSTRSRRLSWKVSIIFIATTLAVLITTTMMFVYRLADYSRGVLFLFYFLTLFMLSVKYLIMRLVLQKLRASGFNIKHEVVIGTGKLARQYAADVENEKGLGIQIEGFVGKSGNELKQYMGGFEALDQILTLQAIDEAVIALDPEEYMHIRDLIGACEKNGVKYFIIPFYNDVIPAHPMIETIGNSKLINMRANRLEAVGWGALKRAFDIIASGLGLIVLSPLILFLAFGVKLSSPGPVLFKQVRVGYKRREFKMLKFRSMKINGEETTGWTKTADSRRTRFGSLIRKTSLDELPQLWNVLKGDMSLVGPRPELPFFVEQFKETVPYYMVKHQVKPGITGWAQINGYRGDTSIEKRVELDLWYIDHWSMELDLKIIFRTIFGGMVNREAVNPQTPDE